MKVLLVNTYAETGGAAMAANRLQSALNHAGVMTRLLVQNAESMHDTDVVPASDCLSPWRPLLDALPVLSWRRRRSPHWGNAWLNNAASRRAILDEAPDIVHLHWINHGFLSVEDVARLPRPLVWTLHDSWAFTGGCHSPQDCRRFEQCCGACPELGSRREGDISRWVFRRKQKAWKNLNLTIITPSRWLARNAESSSLLGAHRIEVIPNAISMEIFKPMDRKSARQQLGLPVDKSLFLFAGHGAIRDWNKGGDLWLKALKTIAEAMPGMEAVVAGRDMQMGTLSFAVHSLGALDPSRMALALNAVDALILPSRMENLPNIAAESLACGTPVAAFAAGGLPEMIKSGQTGYLAAPYDAQDLARGLVQLMRTSEKLRTNCIQSAQRYRSEEVARQHIHLYGDILGVSTHAAH